MKKRVLFIGGTGTLSTSALAATSTKCFDVGALTRGIRGASELPDGVVHFKADRTDEPELARVLLEFKPDIIVDFACFIPEQLRAIVSHTRGRIDQYLFVSAVDVYGFPLSTLPMKEGDHRGRAVSKLAADKRACEEMLLAEARGSDYPSTIVRPAYSFGPTYLTSLFSSKGGLSMISRLRAGKPILVPGDGARLLHVGTGYDTGRMIAEIIGIPFAVGRSYTCAHPTVMTQAQYVDLFARALGTLAHFVFVPADLLLSLDTREEDELLPALTQFNQFYSIDAFKEDFPYFTWKLGLEDAAKQVISWNDERGLIPQPLPSAREDFEDTVIAAWRRAARDFRIA